MCLQVTRKFIPDDVPPDFVKEMEEKADTLFLGYGWPKPHLPDVPAAHARGAAPQPNDRPSASGAGGLGLGLTLGAAADAGAGAPGAGPPGAGGASEIDAIMADDDEAGMDAGGGLGMGLELGGQARGAPPQDGRPSARRRLSSEERNFWHYLDLLLKCAEAHAWKCMRAMLHCHERCTSSILLPSPWAIRLVFGDLRLGRQLCGCTSVA